MDQRRFQLSLVVLQLVGLATLLRSIAFDRWITVLASVLLLVGASAAHRGRSWGVALSFAAAVAFPVAWAIGIAPPWFCLVGVAGAMPFALTSKAFARFDKGAATLLTVLAASAGAIGAIAWKEIAWTVFEMVPALRPSLHAQHGLALIAVVASALVASRLGRAPLGLEEASRVRVAGELRVAADLDSELGASSVTDAEVLDDEPLEPRRARRP